MYKDLKLITFIKTNWINLAILLGLILVAYFNSFNNAFLSDDIAEIRDNPNIGNLSNILKSPFGFIRLILYWLNYNIFGLSPFAFRIINYLFHTGSVFLIYILLNTLHLSKRSAFFVAAIFAIHPAISEAVVWISGGTYPQYTFFFLLSFLFYILSGAKNSSSAYILSARRKSFYLLSSIFYLLSLMSHPVMPLPLFSIFLLYEFSFGDIKKNWLKSIPYLGISLVYVFINLWALPERESTLQNVHYQQKGVDNIFLLIPLAIYSYFKLIFLPLGLTLYHSELSHNIFRFAIDIILTLILFGFIVLAFIKRQKVIFFWLVFFLICLSPTLTPFRFNWIVAERYLYLPILGILVVFVLLLEKLLNRLRTKRLDVFLFGAIILLLIVRTFTRNIDWKSEDNLWIAASKTSPSSPNNHNNLGDMYGRWGNKQKAIEEFQSAIALKPNYADAYHNMANTYRELGQMDKALESYLKAIELNPILWQSYQNTAAIYFAQQKYGLALDYIQKAISINPSNLNLRLNLGVLYIVSGQKEKAKEVFNLILSADPQNQIARQGLIEANK